MHLYWSPGCHWEIGSGDQAVIESGDTRLVDPAVIRRIRLSGHAVVSDVSRNTLTRAAGVSDHAVIVLDVDAFVDCLFLTQICARTVPDLI